MSSVVRNFMAGLSPRERRLVVVMGVTAALMIFAVSAFVLRNATARKARNAAEWAELTNLVRILEPQYLEVQQAGQRLQQMGRPTPLRTLVDSTVERVGISEPDTKELNAKTHASGWTERNVEVSFSSVTLPQLVSFLETVEKNRQQFPFAVTRLDVRTLKNTAQYRVTMTLATYEKVDPPADKTGKVVSAREGRK